MDLKVHYYYWPSVPKVSKQTLKIMKLIAIILFAACLQVSASGYSQITLSETNTPLQKVFQKIQQQSGYDFVSAYETIQEAGYVTVNVRNVSLPKALEACLKGKSLNYVIIGKTVVVRTQEKSHDNLSTTIGTMVLPPPPIEIHGSVVNQQGEPLQNASVLISGTKIGTTTDRNGYFTLTTTNNTNIVLEISSVGYQTKKIKVTGQTEINVTLELAVTGLSDIVVVGYGTQKKSDLTGSVSQVTNKDLQAVPSYNIGEALQGRASGVDVVSNSGRPGARIQVRVRGSNSMIGSNDPLYVVDGFPITGGINFLNSSDIESIDILKDASATAIYGARGANGVVIITTKRGKKGEKSAISINSYFGTQQVAKQYDVLNAKQYAEVANEWLKNSGQQPFFNVDTVTNPGTDWQDAIFRVAPIQNHTLTFSGSSDKTNYSLSGNYFKQEGIVINSGVQRGSFRLNLDHKIKDWMDLAVNLNLSRREQTSVPVDNGVLGNGVLSGALSAPPTLPVYDDNGLPTQITQLYSFASATLQNPLIFSSPYKSQSLANTILLNSALNFKITKDFSFRTRLGLEYENSASHSFAPIIYSNDRGSASNGNTFWNSFVNENILTYNKSLRNDQQINIIGGFTYQTYQSRSSNTSVSGFSNNVTQDFDLGSAETNYPPSSDFSQWKLASWLGRANYSFHNKYYVTGSVRADGSSRFGKDNKWGIFPSGALAWRISNESFMKEVHFINELKLRSSYGITGNTALSPYQSLDKLSSVNYIYGNQTQSVGYAPSGISNSELKWETTGEFDIGFDLNVLDSRIAFTFDYYNKHTKNLLASVPLPPSVGFGSILTNIGEIQNHGFEFSVNAAVLNKAFKWNIAAQLSANRNKVLKLAGGSDIVGSGANTGLPGMNIARVGEPLGAFYGYLENGLDENGYLKYLDVNKDSVIDPSDRVILGNPYPSFTFGFNSTFSYKNFDLNLFLQGSYGNDIVFRTAYSNLNSFYRGTNQFADLIGNYWTASKPNPNAKYPIVSNKSSFRPSNRFIENGSYVRVKSLELGYSIPSNKKGTSWFTSARVYVRATNLFTITNYPGLDPEVNTAGNDSQSIESRLQIGIDENGYPNARIFGAGIQLSL